MNYSEISFLAEDIMKAADKNDEALLENLVKQLTDLYYSKQDGLEQGYYIVLSKYGKDKLKLEKPDVRESVRIKGQELDVAIEYLKARGHEPVSVASDRRGKQYIFCKCKGKAYVSLYDA